MSRDDIINDPEYGNKAEAFEAFDDIPTNPHLDNTIGAVISRRYGRRDMLRGMLGVSAATALFGTSAMVAPKQAAAMSAESRYKFDELTWGNDTEHHIADGYSADILVRWGDPITADAPEFDVMNQSAEAQAQQTKLIADAINAGGEAAINYDIVKRQVDAIGTLGAAENSKTLVLPTNVTETLGALASLKELTKSDT